MNSIENRKGKRLHSRSMEIVTYACDEAHIIVEGCLKDDRLVETYHISGEKRPPQIVHDMTVQVLIDCGTLTIEDVHTEMPSVPHDGCDQTSGTLDKLKGMRISPGFTSKVKRAFGGKRGCLHLTTLVLAMAPAIMQGFWVHGSRDPDGRIIEPDLIENYLVDTCWVWRRDGDLIKKFSPPVEKTR
jgi:hypothetical protein